MNSAKAQVKIRYLNFSNLSLKTFLFEEHFLGIASGRFTSWFQPGPDLLGEGFVMSVHRGCDLEWLSHRGAAQRSEPTASAPGEGGRGVRHEGFYKEGLM